MANKYKTSWMHPRSKQWHLINYVIVRRRDIRDVRITRATLWVRSRKQSAREVRARQLAWMEFQLSSSSRQVQKLYVLSTTF